SRSGGSSCRIGQSSSTSLGSSAPTTSSRLAPRRQGRDGIARAPHYARRRIDKKKPAGPRRRMAGFFVCGVLRLWQFRKQSQAISALAARCGTDSKRLLPHFNFVRGILAALLVGSERLREQSVSAWLLSGERAPSPRPRR